MNNYKNKTIKNKNKALAVVVTYTDWHEPPRIRHQITNQLIRFYNVIYIVKQLDNRFDYVERISKKLIIYTPGINFYIPKRLYANDPFTHYIVDKYFTIKISNFVKRYSSNKIFLINFIYDFMEIMKDNIFKYKMYICFDEFPKMQRKTNKRNRFLIWYQTKLFQYYEKKVAKYSNKCLATHYPLRDKILNFNKNTEFFPPGHEFKKLNYKNLAVKRDKKINIGYMGYINYRIKLDWILEILKNNDMVLNLIGPKEKYQYEKLLDRKNLNYIKPLYGNKLLQKLREMDVLIIPWDSKIPEIEILTVSNKLFQYIAAAKPIIISKLPNFIKLPKGVIYIANDEKEFIKKIRQAYREDNIKYIKIRLKIADENTWDIRGNKLNHLINDAISS